MAKLLQKVKSIKNMQLYNKEYILIFLGKTHFTTRKVGKLFLNISLVSLNHQSATKEY